MEKTKYFYRPDDYSIYEKVDGGYTSQANIKRHCSGNTYSYETLVDHKFIPCNEEDLPALKEKEDLYYEWMSWSTRPDGHGGNKGGTMEQYLKMKNG